MHNLSERKSQNKDQISNTYAKLIQTVSECRILNKEEIGTKKDDTRGIKVLNLNMQWLC